MCFPLKNKNNNKNTSLRNIFGKVYFFFACKVFGVRGIFILGHVSSSFIGEKNGVVFTILSSHHRAGKLHEF